MSTNNTLKTVCVYCGSANAVKELYRDAAREAGTLLGQRGLDVVYGGGHVGLMGIVADAALAAGAQVTGIIPQHIQAREVAHTTLTELAVVDTMHERKTMMVDKSDAFLILPGGFGTMDEFFEILTWRQLKLHSKPVVIANIGGYWNPLIALMDHQIAEGFARASDRAFIVVVDTIPEAVDALFAAPAEADDPATKWM
ncbi:MAG: TIGR00730 family Rossman fold protein [Alphaproteobacteria bacterium]|nr:TIGR00730 family Rossman fold protein [Alphaproteobacteria bacterium]MBU0858711.1 TIGR00730 family Rossman fold protein [Alphaproteobacteria bacterium]